jgi:hypothetical protein
VVVDFYEVFKGHFGVKVGFDGNLLPVTAAREGKTVPYCVIQPLLVWRDRWVRCRRDNRVGRHTAVGSGG